MGAEARCHSRRQREEVGVSGALVNAYAIGPTTTG